MREEKLTPQEAATLAEWEGRSPEHAAFISMLMDEASLSEKIKVMLASEEQEPWQRIERALAAEWNDRAEPAKKKANWGKYAVAASVVVLAGLALYYFGFNKTTGETIVAKKEVTINDVVPGGISASLTLSDGSSINLRTAANGKLTDQQGTTVTKKEDGKLEYEQSNGSTTAAVENLLKIPKGGQYQLTLADKTIVWLNSATNINYPVSFKGNERKVEITGEAYFDVAHDANRKFIVVVKNSGGARKSEIEVMGTQFNIRAYDNETITASLVQGKIKMAASELKPGQQAQLTNDNTIKVVDADLEQALAWKTEYFHFNSADIQTILLEIGRWYNVNIVIQGKLSDEPTRFVIKRNTPFSNMMKALQGLGFNCTFENGTLIVKPQ